MMNQFSKILELAISSGCAYRTEAPMKEYTSFKIGGAVPLMLFPDSVEQIQWIVREIAPLAPVRFLGRGSNLLVADDGADLVIVRLGHRFSAVTSPEENILLCEAGAPLAKAAFAALQRGLTGLEFAWGIPGSVGGAAYMNAGAYGGEMKDVVLYCEHIDETGAVKRMEADELEYGYRRSFYTGREHLCITRVALRLAPGDPQKIRARMDELMDRRKSKQPLEYPSAGSTFKRPEGAYAAALIESCGLKGLSVGDAMVSPKHSGFLINTGNASCRDMLSLISRVQETVLKETGFFLEREVQLLGTEKTDK